MSSPPTDLLSRAARWLLPAALLALAPKCVLCLAAYVGLGAALGLGGPELCGAPDSANPFGVTSALFVVGAALFVVGAALGGIGFFRHVRGRHR